MKIPCSIGIDIGGTKMAVGLINAQGDILCQRALPTESARGFAHAIQRLLFTITDILGATENPPIQGIGIGCAGPVDSVRGTIHNPFTLPGWEGAELVSPLKEAFRTHVYLENDVDAALLGECMFGAGRNANPVVMVTLGTGIGGAVMINGHLHRGAAGEHAEFGHIPVSFDNTDCYCGISGCWESLASGTAIATLGKQHGYSDTRSVFEGAARGEIEATRIIENAVHATSLAVWTLFHTFLPQRLVLGGGIMAEHFPVFFSAIHKQLERATQFCRRNVSVVPASLGSDAGLIGAAQLPLHNPITPHSSNLEPHRVETLKEMN